MKVARLKDLLNEREIRMIKTELLEQEVRALSVDDLESIGLFLIRIFYESIEEIESVGAAALHVLAVRAKSVNLKI